MHYRDQSDMTRAFGPGADLSRPQAGVAVNGNSLSVGQVVRVSRFAEPVSTAAEAMARLESTRAQVLELAASPKPVYGLNTGLGLNKDQRVAVESVGLFNRNVILSHATGIAPDCAEDEVRATILVRLNTLLCGHTGAQPGIAQMYRDFLNFGIHPVVPSRGSVGQCDIAILSHIGLGLIGEGEVDYRGQRMPATEALQMHGLEPIVPGVKDGLAIVSSNAYSAALSCLLLDDIADLLLVADAVYTLTLEGILGNVEPLYGEHDTIRPINSTVAAARRMRGYLQDSDLWSGDRITPVHDPLSIRCSAQVHGAVQESWMHALRLVQTQINSSDDNPTFLPDRGEFIATGNSSVTSQALAFESLGLALNQMAHVTGFRTHALANPTITGLTRFLTPDPDRVIGFAVLQKTIMALDAEMRHMANPVTSDWYAMAGHMEDQATNAPYVMIKTRRMVDILWQLLAIEAIHGAQAVDLRGKQKLGRAPAMLYQHLRKLSPMLDRDRPMGAEIAAVAKHLRSDELIAALSPLDDSRLKALLS